jgi:hypothetical protein
MRLDYGVMSLAAIEDKKKKKKPKEPKERPDIPNPHGK